jgi:hypothetical protein
VSASAITDGFITQLGAASAFGVDVSDTYRVLETTSGSCCVVNWTGATPALGAFGGGGTLNYVYVFSIESFIKVKEQPSANAPRVSATLDTVLTCLYNNMTIQGTVEDITKIESKRELPPEGLLEVGGHLWHRMVTEVTVLDFNDS